MNIETIHGMINNSTWTDKASKRVYRFANGKDLSINGKNHLEYSLNTLDNKIILELGSEKKYFVDYVNDFNLWLSNGEEKFKIMPE
jgi:hypothetical protein